MAGSKTSTYEVAIDQHLKVQARRNRVTASLDRAGLYALSDREAEQQLYQLGNRIPSVATADAFEPSDDDVRARRTAARRKKATTARRKK